MKRRIKSLAKELNYQPNPFAQSLRKESTHLIGVIAPNQVTHFFASVLDGIEDSALQHGYFVIPANSHESHLEEERAIDNFISLHVEGIIACIAQDTIDYSWYRKLYDMEIPVVFFARTCLPDKFSQVVSDDMAAAYKATTHLIEQGCKRIAFLGGPNHLDMARRRKHGYLQALKDAKMPVDRTIVINGNFDFTEARASTMALLSQENRPDAILAVNNILTFAAFDAIKSMHLHIPEDVAIMGFSADETATAVTPNLSVIKDQAHMQGREAFELLLQHIEGDKKLYQKIVPMILKIRESSKKNA
jgi:LacI family transcriptional regulator